MHILVIAVGTSGDVHPLLGISRTLVERGHRVSFATSPNFAGAVERCGLKLVPLGTIEEYQAAVNDPKMWNPKRSIKEMWLSVASRIRPMFDLLHAQVDDETVLAAHPWSFSSRLLSEKFGIPLVTTQVSPSTFFSAKKPPVHKKFTVPAWLPYPVRAGLMRGFHGVLDRIISPEINKIRAGLGMTPNKRVVKWLHSPYGVLGLFPEWFAEPQTDWPAKVTLTGFPLFDEGGIRPVDTELEDFLAEGSAPLVFTAGSTLVDGMAFYSSAAAALSKLGRRGVFLASESTKMPSLGPNVLVRSYVPLSKLLPRSQALVHHGGIGTAALAFAAGIPQLITPFAADQHDNSVRVVESGCGFIVDKPNDQDVMLKSLRRVLDDEKMQRSVALTQAKMDSGEEARLKAATVIETVGAAGLLRGAVKRELKPQLV